MVFVNQIISTCKNVNAVFLTIKFMSELATLHCYYIKQDCDFCVSLKGKTLFNCLSSSSFLHCFFFFFFPLLFPNKGEFGAKKIFYGPSDSWYNSAIRHFSGLLFFWISHRERDSLETNLINIATCLFAYIKIDIR